MSDKTTPPAKGDDLPASTEATLALIDRAEQGDATAMPPLRKLLGNPAAVDQLGGNLAETAQRVLVEAHCGQNLFRREAIGRKMATLRAELAGPTPSPIEWLLAERAVACWLHVYHLEAVYAGKGAMSLPLAEHYQKCIDRAHKRYVSALKALAEVRKLGVTVQLNVARKQVNVLAT
ncbi:MAG: hypothetical protein JWO38_1666 [Gemmataceae bacterium]|nr:hypothetical protein [Gemmataceae bacterium]